MVEVEGGRRRIVRHERAGVMREGYRFKSSWHEGVDVIE
jgi:hypothetical protein